MGGWVRDARHALRGLGQAPGFTLITVLTLALGVGASTAMFNVVNGVLLRPLRYRDAERLVTLCERHPSVAGFCVASPPDVLDWADQSRTLSSIGLGREWSFLLGGPGGIEPVSGGIATPQLFEVLGLAPALGRLFTLEECGAGNDRVVVLADRLWRGRFAADPAVVGSTIALDGEPHTVVGVLPADAEVPQLEGRELWKPLHFDPREEQRREWRGFLAYARLAPGATLDAAQAEIETIAARLTAAWPATNTGWTVELRPLREHLVRDVRPALLVFFAAVACVLSIGCANVANLLLGRAGARRREFAVRAALGAGRAALVRLQLAESLVLGLAGGALGLLLSIWLVDAYAALAPGSVPRLDELGLDGRVLGFALAASLLAGAISGLVPALVGTRGDLRGELEGGGSRSASAARHGTRATLVAAEIAVALVLLVGAGLLGRSFLALVSWQPGFERERLLAFWMLGSDGRFASGDAVNDVFERAVASLRTLPGVVEAATVSAGPVFGGRETGEIAVVGPGAPPPGERPVVRWYDAGPGYFATLGLPLVRGRDFDAGDTRSAPPVAVVNEALARRLFPGGDALGAQVEVEGGALTIVGVAPDVPPLRADEAQDSEIWWPQRQRPRWGTWVLLRTATEPGALVDAARERLLEVDPDLSVSRGASFPELLRRRTVRPRFDMLLLGGFALAALALAAIGVYGVLAAAVAERTREIGIRVALGAGRRKILVAAIRRGMLPVAAGMAAGLAGALALGRLLAALLVGVRPTDPLTFVTVSALLLLVACGACWLPARRAARLDPLVALRRD